MVRSCIDLGYPFCPYFSHYFTKVVCAQKMFHAAVLFLAMKLCLYYNNNVIIPDKERESGDKYQAGAVEGF